MKKSFIICNKGEVRFLTRGMKTVAGKSNLNFATVFAQKDLSGKKDLSVNFVSDDLTKDLTKDLLNIFDVLAVYFPDEALLKKDILSNEGLSTVYLVDMIVGKLEAVVDEINSLNKRGFVNKFDLDEKNFPITNKIVNSLLALNEDGKIKKTFDKFTNIEKLEFSKWWYNVIMLDLYYVIEVLIHNEKVREYVGGDRLLELKDFAKDLKSGLESYIRLGFMRCGITVFENTYTGFDTEYQLKEGIFNELISAQLAVCSRLVVKMANPVDRYDNKGVNTENSQVYKKSEVKSFNFLNQTFIFDTIDRRIKDLRSLFYPGYDKVLRRLVKGLCKKVPYVVKGEFIYFMFPKANLKTWFTTEVQEGISLLNLIQISNNLSKNDLDEAVGNLYNDLKFIFENEEDDDSKSLFEFEKDSKSEDLEVEVEEEGVKFDQSIFEDETYVEEDEENLRARKLEEILFAPNLYESGKKYSRTYKQSFTGSRASVTRVKKNYLIAHMSSADLCMLKDFEIFKHKIDIVNKAYVTLKQPLLIEGVNVIVRDTMLLSPGGNKSLASLGELYNLKKIGIGGNIRRMKDFQKEDPKCFKEYALQDSRITLVHALFLEEFGFRLGVIGVPLSLSMLASAYLRKS